MVVVVVVFGLCGMIGGQVDDLQVEGYLEFYIVDFLELIYCCKIGEFIVLLVRIFGFYVGVFEVEDELLECFGELFGLMFQMVDDILDVEGDIEILGKIVGKDMQVVKFIYFCFFGFDEIWKRVWVVEEEVFGIVCLLLGDVLVYVVLVDFFVYWWY